jgi:hypothetical protein
MITTIWKHFFLMWEERNLLVHGHDTKTRTIANRRRMATEFRYLHTKRNEVLATDHDLFIGENDDDVAAFIDTVSPTYIENWLQIWKPVILDSAKTATAFSLASIKPMTSYFETVRQTLCSQRPPKPRYSKTSHTRNDGRIRLQRGTTKLPASIPADPKPSNPALPSQFNKLSPKTPPPISHSRFPICDLRTPSYGSNRRSTFTRNGVSIVVTAV